MNTDPSSSPPACDRPAAEGSGPGLEPSAGHQASIAGHQASMVPAGGAPRLHRSRRAG